MIFSEKKREKTCSTVPSEKTVTLKDDDKKFRWVYLMAKIDDVVFQGGV